MSNQFNHTDQQIWDQIFSDVPTEWKTHPPTEHMEDCCAFFELMGIKSVLDIGCGIGRWSTYLANEGFDLCAYDFSIEAINYAKKWATEEQLNIQYMCSELSRDPFPKQKFDAILAAMVFHNVVKNELDICLEIIDKKLEDGAILYILNNPFFTAEMEAEYADSSNPTKEITQINYTDEELIDLFNRYRLLDFKTYEDGTRGLFLQKH